MNLKAINTCRYIKHRYFAVIYVIICYRSENHDAAVNFDIYSGIALSSLR